MPATQTRGYDVVGKPPLGSEIDWSHPVTRGLVLWHMAAEGAGSAAPDSVTRAKLRAGVLTGDTAWVPGKFGPAWSFGTSFISLGSTHGLPIGLNQAFSFALWVWSNAAQASVLLDNSNGSTGVCWQIFLENLSGDFIRYQYNNSQATTATFDSQTGLTWPLKTWRFVVVTDDGLNTTSSVSIYIDGVKQTLSTTTAATGGKKTANQATAWGQTTTGGQNQFVGRLDNVMIWTRVLNAAEVLGLFYSPFECVLPDAPRRAWKTAGTLFTQTVSAASSAVGVVIRQAQPVRSGASSAAAAVVKQGSAAKSAASPASGIAVKQTATAKSAGSTVLGAVLRTFGRTVSGSSTATGATVRQAQKNAAGASSAAGSTLKSVGATRSASSAAAGSVVKQGQKNTTGGSAAGGSVVKQAGISKSAGTAAVGSATKQAGKNVAAGSAAGGAVQKLAALVRGAVSPALASVSTFFTAAGGTLFTLTVSAASSAAASVQKRVNAARSGSSPAAGTVTKQTARSVSAASPAVGSVSKLVGRAVQAASGLLAFVVALSSRLTRTILQGRSGGGMTGRSGGDGITGRAGGSDLSGQSGNDGFSGRPGPDDLSGRDS